jgi:hypothetical protein
MLLPVICRLCRKRHPPMRMLLLALAALALLTARGVIVQALTTPAVACGGADCSPQSPP